MHLICAPKDEMSSSFVVMMVRRHSTRNIFAIVILFRSRHVYWRYIKQNSITLMYKAMWTIRWHIRQHDEDVVALDAFRLLFFCFRLSARSFVFFVSFFLFRFICYSFWFGLTGKRALFHSSIFCSCRLYKCFSFDFAQDFLFSSRFVTVGFFLLFRLHLFTDTRKYIHRNFFSDFISLFCCCFYFQSSVFFA